LNKKPWEIYPGIWSTKAKFFSFIRGGIRKGLWNTNPVKLEFIKRNRIKIKNPNPKGKVAEVWGAECCLCNEQFPQKDIQVDHKQGNNSLNSTEDLESFISAIVFVSEEDLQFVCKTCHKVKSYSEKQKISFAEAVAIKKAIDCCKQPVAKQKAELLSYGFTEGKIASQDKRRKCYEVYFKKESDKKQKGR